MAISLRETKKARTRGDILKVARELFLKRGFDETRVSDIARRLLVSEQTVFNYFPSKQAIVEALAAEWLAENARVAGPGPLPGDSVLDAGRIGLGLYLLRLSPHRDYIRLLLDHSSIATVRPGGAGHGPTEEATRLQVRMSSELYRAAQRTGEIRPDVDPAELAELVFYVVGWSLRTWVDTEPPPSLLELAFRRVRLVMAGALTGVAPELDALIAKVERAARAAHR